MRAFHSIGRIACVTIILVLGVLPLGNARAEPRVRAYTADQILKIGADALQQSSNMASHSDTGVHDAAKTLANGTYMDGTFSYTISGRNVTLEVDRINNDSFTATTGTLRLEMWATTSRPARGSGFTGYHLATTATFSGLAPRTFYSNVVRTAALSEPPAGTYWLVLVLSEFNTGCVNNYCVQDSGIFTNQRTFGAAPPSGNVTVASREGQQCYENFARGAFDLLQQITPGLFQSYSSSTTCASLGMPFYAGVLATNTSVRVYTTNATVAQLLCATGAIASCTTAPTSGSTYTDIWWNPAESGWGVTITHHPSGNAFIAWYTYDNLGNPKWYVAPECRVVNAGCTGSLYETSGPAFGTPFNPAMVTARTVGSVTFAFSGPTTGLMSYNVRGITGAKLITRQPF